MCRLNGAESEFPSIESMLKCCDVKRGGGGGKMLTS